MSRRADCLTHKDGVISDDHAGERVQDEGDVGQPDQVLTSAEDVTHASEQHVRPRYPDLPQQKPPPWAHELVRDGLQELNTRSPRLALSPSLGPGNRQRAPTGR